MRSSFGIAASSYLASTSPTPTLRATMTVAEGAADSETWTTSSFTPSANSKLYVAAFARAHDSSTNAPDIGCSGGSLTWTRQTQSSTTATSAKRSRSALLEASVGSSPSSMTVTIDLTTGAPVGWGWIAAVVFDVTPSTTSIKSGQITSKSERYGSGSGSSSATHTTTAFPGACTNGNLAVFALGCLDADPGEAMAVPSGWTALANPSGEGDRMSVFTRTDFTGTSVTCSDVGAWIFTAASVFMELQQ